MSKGMVSMGIMMFGSRFVDLTNPGVLQAVRALYLMLGVAYWQVYSGMEERVNQAKDETPIWIPEKKSKGLMDMLLGSSGAPADGAPAESYKKTTVYEHELELAKAKGSSAFMSAAQPFFMAQFMGFNIMLLMRIVMLPWDMMEDPLVLKYVLGWPTGNRPYGELYADPAAPAAARRIAAADGGGAEGGAAPAAAGPIGADGRDPEFEEAIFRTWESADPVEIGIFEHLLGAAGKDPNYSTVDQGWTALQVVAGSPQNGRREAVRLLELGCKPEPADKDGWTALHWASFHGNATAVRVLAAAYGVDLPEPAGASSSSGPKTKVPKVGTADDLRSLLKMRDSEGRTPADVATLKAEAAGDAADVAPGKAGEEVAKLLAAALKEAEARVKAEEGGHKSAGGAGRRVAQPKAAAAAPKPAAPAEADPEPAEGDAVVAEDVD